MFNAFVKNLVYRHNKQEVDAQGRKINTKESDIYTIGLLFTADHKTVDDIRYRDVTHICIMPYKGLKCLDIDDYIIADGETYVVTNFNEPLLNSQQTLYLKKVSK